MAVNNQHKYADKMAEMQVLACLIKDPMLFSDNKYKFNKNELETLLKEAK